MALRMSRRRGFPSRNRQRSARRYRWVSAIGSGAVNPGTATSQLLLTPLQPVGTIADQIYQQMTNPTLIAVYGHLTVKGLQSYSAATGSIGNEMQYAWGIYVDKDVASVGTYITPYSEANTSTWMMWHSGSVQTPSFLSSVGAGTTAFAFLGDNDFLYRRYELRQRKYKRKLDSYNDTLVFVIENGTPAVTGDATIGYSFFFRMLLLE